MDPEIAALQRLEQIGASHLRRWEQYKRAYPEDTLQGLRLDIEKLIDEHFALIAPSDLELLDQTLDEIEIFIDNEIVTPWLDEYRGMVPNMDAYTSQLVEERSMYAYLRGSLAGGYFAEIQRIKEVEPREADGTTQE